MYFRGIVPKNMLKDILMYDDILNYLLFAGDKDKWKQSSNKNEPRSKEKGDTLGFLINYYKIEYISTDREDSSINLEGTVSRTRTNLNT